MVSLVEADAHPAHLVALLGRPPRMYHPEEQRIIRPGGLCAVAARGEAVSERSGRSSVGFLAAGGKGQPYTATVTITDQTTLV